jgi:hypothetical protein
MRIARLHCTYTYTQTAVTVANFVLHTTSSGIMGTGIVWLWCSWVGCSCSERQHTVNSR